MSTRPVKTMAPEVLRDYMERLLRAAGCSDVNAKEAAEVFLEADMRGMGMQGLDHMFSMFRDLERGTIDGTARAEVVSEGLATAMVDGHWGPGQPAAVLATDTAIRKAREAGCATVGLINGADIYLVGYYVERMAQAGLVGFAFCVSPSLVHPYGGVERRMGTNPLAIGIPTAGDPMVFDMATSALSFSRVKFAAYHDEPLPEGMGVDPDGNPTTDASKILNGAVAPLAGHKGFGLSLCVALLSGPLMGGNAGKAIDGWHKPTGEKARRSQTFIAIDPAAFGDPDDFRANAQAYLDEVKSARKAPGVDTIRYPGERTFARRRQSLAEGVEVLEKTWKIAREYAEKLGVDVPA
ncbi:MAG: Ldh family oxidoreductase [Rhodospirillaceae bacterium]|jgi:LDH2 family malate/lactate/ureidoglycolate dehydrogenase|nr:Ldh family oxidoreductase [Rhodospirillaceae bacterium]